MSDSEAFGVCVDEVDPIDEAEAEEAYAEFLEDPVTYSHEEACRMCGLQIEKKEGRG